MPLYVRIQGMTHIVNLARSKHPAAIFNGSGQHGEAFDGALRDRFGINGNKHGEGIQQHFPLGGRKNGQSNQFLHKITHFPGALYHGTGRKYKGGNTMELLCFVLFSLTVIGLVLSTAEPETLEEQAERLEKERAREGHLIRRRGRHLPLQGKAEGRDRA